MGRPKSGSSSFQDLAGKKFTRLLCLTYYAPNDWLCLCDCGTKLLVRGPDLRNGHTRSCGCLAKEIRTSHGKWGTAEYWVWHSMIQRCYNKKREHYVDYGGRGITVCQEWRDSFAEFLSYMGDRPSSKHTLDRENPNGNYEPGNVRWTTWDVQARNKRKPYELFLTYKGETYPLKQWAKITGLKYATLFNRLKIGWEPDRILSTVSRNKPKVRL